VSLTVYISSLLLTDWFAAGKGPNPVVAALDQDMDNYFKSRAEKVEEAVAAPAPVNNV
jgi:hypothetical protein